MIIECDTRQQKQEHITSYFDKQKIKYIRNKLYAGDYKTTDSTKVIIDTKKDLMEICGNLARKTEHERIKREIDRAKEIGCERFIFLIAHNYIRSVKQVYAWEVPIDKYTRQPRTRVKPLVLQKIMLTMQEKYGVEFMFCRKQDMGKRIVELLSEVGNG